jgi:hypothetical protein
MLLQTPAFEVAVGGAEANVAVARAKLWASSDAHAPTVLRGLLSEAETAFIDYRDVALVLDKTIARITKTEMR